MGIKQRIKPMGAGLFAHHWFTYPATSCFRTKNNPPAFGPDARRILQAGDGPAA